MNSDEKIANSYLASLGGTRYEPDGNIPPDFLLNGEIAIEVRRLNQNFRDQNGIKGLEVDEIPFIRMLESELRQYSAAENEKRYWLSLRYRRPFGNAAEIKANLKKALIQFLDGGEVLRTSHNLSRNVQIAIASQASNTEQKFSLGIFNDFDDGGWVIDMYATELNHCIEEKSRKIRHLVQKYPNWWLVLVDHLGYISREDKRTVLDLITSKNLFSQVKVIRSDGSLVLEI